MIDNNKRVQSSGQALFVSTLSCSRGVLRVLTLHVLSLSLPACSATDTTKTPNRCGKVLSQKIFGTQHRPRQRRRNKFPKIFPPKNHAFRSEKFFAIFSPLFSPNPRKISQNFRRSFRQESCPLKTRLGPGTWFVLSQGPTAILSHNCSRRYGLKPRIADIRFAALPFKPVKVERSASGNTKSLVLLASNSVGDPC